MTININPYADVLSFPAGTPASVINAVLAIRARSEAQANQPSWLDEGINNIINGATNKLLFPWLQNEFVNLPYQTDLQTMKTDQEIRQYGAQQGILTDQELQRLRDKMTVANEGMTQLGGAIDQYGQYSQPTPESITDTGPATPYGPYEDPWTSSPGPQYSPPLNNFGNVAPESGQANIQDLISQQSSPTQLQGDIAPTNRERIMKYTPEKTPNIADTLKAMAGSGAQGTLNAGLMANLFEKPNMMSAFDPLKLQERTAQLALRSAQQADTESKTRARDELTPAQLDMLRSKLGLNEQQMRLIAGKADEQDMRVNALATMNEQQLIDFYSKKSDQRVLPASVRAELEILKSKNPTADPKTLVEQAVNNASNRKIQDDVRRNVMSAMGQIDPKIAVNEIPKVQAQIRDITSSKRYVAQLDNAIEGMNQHGFFPANDSMAAVAAAEVRRQIYQSQWQQDLQNYYGIVEQLGNAVQVAQERSIGDKGARIAAAYNLHSDPTLISYGNWKGRINMMNTAYDDDLAYLKEYLGSINQRVGRQPYDITPSGKIESTTQPQGGFGAPKGAIGPVVK